MAESTNKKPFYKKWWFWLIVVIIVIGIAGNSQNQAQKVGVVTTNTTTPPTVAVANNSPTDTQTTSTPPPQQTFKTGDQVKLGDYILTVNSVKDCSTGNEFITPQSGNKFVVADITQENNGTDPKSYNELNFKLQDDQGFTSNNSFTSCKTPDFGSGDLQAGQKTRGYITFEIPKNDKPAQLLFTPGWFSSDQIIINLQ